MLRKYADIAVGDIFYTGETKTIRAIKLPGNRAVAMHPNRTIIMHPEPGQEFHQDYPTWLTYQEALVLTLNDKGWTKVQNNSYVQVSANLEPGAIGLKLHETQIITWYPNGNIRIATGGWHSTTTRDRLNRYSPIACRMKKMDGEYYIIAGDFGPLYHDLLIKPGPDGWVLAE